MNYFERLKAQEKTLAYKFWQTDKRDWETFTRYGWVKTPGYEFGYCMPFIPRLNKAVNDNTMPRNLLDVWHHWYRQASAGAWRRSLGV